MSEKRKSNEDREMCRTENGSIRWDWLWFFNEFDNWLWAVWSTWSECFLMNEWICPYVFVSTLIRILLNFNDPSCKFRNALLSTSSQKSHCLNFLTLLQTLFRTNARRNSYLTFLLFLYLFFKIYIKKLTIIIKY